MYKFINPYNKFVWEKKIKQVNTQQNTYTTKICNKKLTFKKCV
jgi:hypothetical protein